VPKHAVSRYGHLRRSAIEAVVRVRTWFRIEHTRSDSCTSRRCLVLGGQIHAAASDALDRKCGTSFLLQIIVCACIHNQPAFSESVRQPHGRNRTFVIAERMCATARVSQLPAAGAAVPVNACVPIDFQQHTTSSM